MLKSYLKHQADVRKLHDNIERALEGDWEAQMDRLLDLMDVLWLALNEVERDQTRRSLR